MTAVIVTAGSRIQKSVSANLERALSKPRGHLSEMFVSGPTKKVALIFEAIHRMKDLVASVMEHGNQAMNRLDLAIERVNVRTEELDRATDKAKHTTDRVYLIADRALLRRTGCIF